jgi:Sap, sulfolipid-1-addressing protein
MWGSVLGVAFLLAIDPLRLGVILILLSRARPVQNLIAYWIGCLVVGIPSLLVPLILLHATSMFGSFGRDLGSPATEASSSMRHFQITMGAVTLLIAALMSVRFSGRQRATVSGRRHRMRSQGGNTTLVQVADPPTAAWQPEAAAGTTTKRASPVRRLLRSARNAWEGGAWWVSLVIGIGSGPPLPLVLVVITPIVASGAALATQVSAGIAFVVVMYSVVEIILVSYLVAPAKTHAALELLHNRLQPHRRKILVAVIAVMGIFTLADGVGIL